jgi:hypothetical protein
MPVSKRIIDCVSFLIASAWCSATCWASDPNALTETEAKWLEAADPVLTFAIAQGLPIDVVVRPIHDANQVPFSMGVQNGRCKLILSMRDRADAEATLLGVPTSQHALMIEAMTAHEVAHCWRYTSGMWNSLPAGFTEARDAGDSESIALKKQEMRSMQREEAFADLVALAWVRQQHPAKYAQVHSWLEHVRHDQPVEGAHHDTRIWLALAQDARALKSGETLFDGVQEVWVQGLISLTTHP